MEDKVVVPYAPILVESTRSIGYSFEAAVADIIDNSISAAATEIYITFMSQDPQWLCIKDNGWGMTADELENAMRYGSQSPEETRRNDDLGRFGLGLKMASLSQCRKVTVLTRKENHICGACWDLDYIIQKEDWALKFYDEEELKEMNGYTYLSIHESGTVVLWENFDRIKLESANSQKAFDEKIEATRKHISLVFHRFLNDENPRDRLSIYFNNEPVKGVDPFLKKHPATQPLSEQILRIGTEEIKVKPYVLPYMSKLSKADLENIGGSDDLRQQQGFYIYRNRRLIIWGTWFKLIKQNELGKLARVRVDIPNSLDSIWDIDIKKSTASLPHFIKKSLADIVRNSVGRSERVYKYRGRNVQTDDLMHAWNPVDNRGTFQYLINRDMPIVNMIENHLDEEGKRLFDSLIKMLEDTFPYADAYYRMAKSDSNASDASVDTNEVYEIADFMIQEMKRTGVDIGEFLKNMDKMDFFVKYPEVVQHIRKEYSDE